MSGKQLCKVVDPNPQLLYLLCDILKKQGIPMPALAADKCYLFPLIPVSLLKGLTYVDGGSSTRKEAFLGQNSKS